MGEVVLLIMALAVNDLILVGISRRGIHQKVDTEPDSVFFREKLWFGVSRWMWIRLAFAFIVIMGAYGLYLGQQNQQEQHNRDHTALLVQRDGRYNSCLDGNKLRAEVRALIDTSYAQGGSLDLTSLPSYQALDPQTKRYMSDLNDALKAPTSAEDKAKRVADAKANVQDIDCDKAIPPVK